MYIYAHTMYIHKYMYVTESPCCKAEINTTLHTSINNMNAKNKDWYVSLNVIFISKKSAVTSTAHYFTEGLLKY